KNLLVRVTPDLFLSVGKQKGLPLIWKPCPGNVSESQRPPPPPAPPAEAPVVPPPVLPPEEPPVAPPPEELPLCDEPAFTPRFVWVPREVELLLPEGAAVPF